MLIKSFLCFIFLFGSLVAPGQPKSIQPYIDAWKKSGKGQSYASQVFFDSLRLSKNNIAARKRYWNDITLLHEYLEKHPDRRLEVRLLMFEIMAAREHGLAPKYYRTIDSAIKKAHALNDPQLNAELYSIRADIPPSSETHLLYNLKAVEIQKSIGYQYFPYVHNRFFGISAILFGQGNYAKCIAYGKEGLATWNLDSVHQDARVYIFQLDLIGASYRNLKKYDSARWYYHNIIKYAAKDSNSQVRKLWTGIAKGNIGRTYTAEAQFELAAPLLYEYLQISLACGDWLNIAIAQNALSDFYYQQHILPAAITFARNALSVAQKQGIRREIIKAAGILADIYRKQKNTDSAFHYYELEARHQTLEREQLKKSELSVINAQIAFDNLQHSLTLAQTAANREKSLRNTILVGISLLTVIVILLYNKKRVKEQIKLREARAKHDQAQQQVAEARERIAVFTKHLIEKNNLINSLREQLEYSQVSATDVTEKLLADPLVTEEGWENFRLEFSKAYPLFFPRLKDQCEGLTPAMERLAALIFLQLNNYQIANTLGISKESVARSKRRLRAVLNMAPEEQLEDRLRNIDNPRSGEPASETL